MFLVKDLNIVAFESVYFLVKSSSMAEFDIVFGKGNGIVFLKLRNKNTALFWKNWKDRVRFVVFLKEKIGV
jgi:hypothetical protein